MQWYQYYRTVLENIGWVVQEFDFDRFNASGSQFTVDKAVLDILAAVATGDELAVAQQTIQAMKSLDAGDGRLVLFESSSPYIEARKFSNRPCYGLWRSCCHAPWRILFLNNEQRNESSLV